MNIHSAVAAAALLLSVVACSSTSTGTGTGTGAGPGGTSGTAGPGAGAAGGNATCDTACTYYLQCKGLDSTNQALCVQRCQQLGYTTEQLAEIQQLDCPNAVAVVEANAGGNAGSSGTSGGSGSGSADYKNSQECAYGECVRDGTYCVVLGSAPRDCPQDCCQ